MRSRKKKPFLKTKKAAILGLLAIGLLSFGTTWAYYYSNDMSLENPLSTTHSEVVMMEDFDPGSSFLPGETVEKVIWFENTGDMDLFLRVEVPPEEGWYADGTAATDLNTEYVIKNWSESWVDAAEDSNFQFDEYSDDCYLKLENDDTGEAYDAVNDLWTEVVIDQETGRRYRYYKKILHKKGEDGDKTKPILKSIRLSENISNDRHVTDYSDKIYKLTFYAEAVPVEGNDDELNAQASWKMSPELEDSNTGILNWK